MKHLKWIFLSLVIIFSFVAFLPALAFPWMEKINWDAFSLAYWVDPGDKISIFLPLISR